MHTRRLAIMFLITAIIASYWLLAVDNVENRETAPSVDIASQQKVRVPALAVSGAPLDHSPPPVGAVFASDGASSDGSSPAGSSIGAPEKKSMRFSEIRRLIRETGKTLEAEKPLSDFNMMVLKDLASRLGDLSGEAGSVDGWRAALADWPAPLAETLERMLASNSVEAELREQWGSRIWQEPESYRLALQQRQRATLGGVLFEKLHREDHVVVSVDGMSATFTPESEAPELNTELHRQRRALLAKWQQGELGAAELSQALSESLSYEEIEQLLETGRHEAAWMEKLDLFLREYQYVEQSGISGEDEMQVRKELVAKHFTEENWLVVDQFLFAPTPAR